MFRVRCFCEDYCSSTLTLCYFSNVWELCKPRSKNTENKHKYLFKRSGGSNTEPPVYPPLLPQKQKTKYCVMSQVLQAARGNSLAEIRCVMSCLCADKERRTRPQRDTWGLGAGNPCCRLSASIRCRSSSSYRCRGHWWLGGWGPRFVFLFCCQRLGGLNSVRYQNGVNLCLGAVAYGHGQFSG